MGGEGQWGLLELASSRQDSKRVRAVGMEKASAQRQRDRRVPSIRSLFLASQRAADLPGISSEKLWPRPLEGSGLGEGGGAALVWDLWVSGRICTGVGGLKRAEGPMYLRQSWPALRPFEGGGQPAREGSAVDDVGWSPPPEQLPSWGGGSRSPSSVL